MFDASAVQSGTATQASRAAASGAKLEEDLNKFLKLLVTQLQNQDPLDPMDANEFTNQLVQFANVEQQIQQNANLESLITIQKTSQVANLVNYVGKNIRAVSSVFDVTGGGGAELSYTLESPATKSTLTIRNADGDVVFSTAAEIDAKTHAYTWDGKDNNGIQVPDGVYSFGVSASDIDDRAVNVQHIVSGHVTSAGSAGGAVNLYMGEVSVPLENVLAIEEAPTP